MKRSITTTELRLLDQLMMMAEEPRRTLEKVAQIMRTALEVEDWDGEARCTIDWSVYNGALMSLDELLVRLGVERET